LEGGEDGGVFRRNEVVGKKVGELLEPERADLGENRAFAGDALIQHDIERGNAVGGDQKYLIFTDRVYIPHFTGRHTRQTGNIRPKHDGRRYNAAC
jgi:hypothetical protein